MPSAVVPPAGLVRTLNSIPPVTVFRAPRGWGKATVASWWLRRLEGIVPVWCVLPRGMGSHDLWRLVDQHLQQLGHAETSWLSGPELVTSVAERMAMHGERLVLVLESYHHVNDPLLDDQIIHLARSNEAVSVMLLTRAEQPIESLAVIDTDGIIVRSRQLALGGDETVALADALGISISDEDAFRIADDVAGWPALVRAMLRAVELGHGDGGQRLVERYLQTVFAEPESAEFAQPLMSLSLMDRIDEPSLREVLGVGEPVELITRPIAEAGLLRSNGDLPAMIRAAAAAVIDEVDPTGAAEIHRRLARRLERLGEPVRALDHAIRGADTVGVLGILTRSWLPLTDHHDAVTRALPYVPEKYAKRPEIVILRDHVSDSGRLPPGSASGPDADSRERLPELMMQWGLYRLRTVNLIGAVQVFSHAHRLARTANDEPQRRAAAWGCALTLAILGQRRGALQWCERGRSLAEEDPPTSTERELRALATWLLNVDQVVIGPPEPIDASGWEGTELVSLAHALDAAFRVRYPAARDSALADLRAQWSVVRDLPAPDLAATIAFVALAGAHLSEGAFDRCSSLLEAQPPAVRETHLPRVRLALSSGDLDRVLALTAQSEQWIALYPRGAIEHLVLRSCALHRLRLVGEALRTMRLAMTVAEMHDLYWPFLSVPAAELRVIATQVPEMRPLLQRVERTRDVAGFPQSERASLTEQEVVILRGLDDGESLGAMAQRLYLSTNTVKSHMRTLYAKLGVHNRADAVHRGHALGIYGSHDDESQAAHGDERPV
ncbi:helix-turn-helix transcriptional regulator [Ruania halotolerans]|uniref:helix-turn-helix transcriptional regulator n=1 Tax=Ruania halotolerans TaxID=2897773 RepID=UPI001E343D19|nr:LuxR C-terminal-related transcriptional regulator [Ruania halotolerans]UFU05738.1 LuxR C-terminal-related transcriptional regulator [Ruania halotolerans]